MRSDQRGALSVHDWRRPGVRWVMSIVLVLLLLMVGIAGLGPILWLFKSAITPTGDIVAKPLAVFPNGVELGNVSEAWVRADIGTAFVNTIWVTSGTWIIQLLVAVPAAYALSVLRPWYGKYLYGAILATLFIPAVVLLVPLYLTVMDLPVLHISLLNSFFGVWLPAGANAFAVLLIKRFFDGLPGEIFEAARIDGAGPVRLLLYVVLPMSQPIIAVVSIFTIIGSMKDYLWPLLVLNEHRVQPLAVKIPQIQAAVPLGTFMAALAIGAAIPVLVFVVFQRSILRAGGIDGAVKG